MLLDERAGDRSEDAGAGGEDADREAVDETAMIRETTSSRR